MENPIIKKLGTLISQSGANHSIAKRKTTTDKQAAGDHAENLAAQLLSNSGIEILLRNFLCKQGEIDLIALDSRSEQISLVFVEVRYRRNQNYGGGLESITHAKQNKLRRSAEVYLLQQGSPDVSCRFDVISVSGPPSEAKIEWIENAF